LSLCCIDGVARLFEPRRKAVARRSHDRTAETSDHRSNETVMLAEDHCLPDPDWAEAILNRIAEGWDGIGCALRPGNRTTCWARGAFLIGYGEWFMPAAAGPTRVLCGLNGTIRTKLLREVGPELAEEFLTGAFLVSRLRRQGYHFFMENRARMLLDVVRAVRATVSPSFAVAVKLNSADFQRGGFDADDARRVIAMLEPLGVDLVELSGGSYESPAMSGRAADARTQAREAYFLDLAVDLVRTSPVPLMLTGGIARRATAEIVRAGGVAVVGMGTALAVTPELPNRWREGREADGQLRQVTWSDKTLASAAGMALVHHQMRRMARGLEPALGTRPAFALISDQLAQRRALRAYRSWLQPVSAESVSAPSRNTAVGQQT